MTHNVSCPLCRRGGGAQPAEDHFDDQRPRGESTWTQVVSLVFAFVLFASGWALKPVLGPAYVVMAHLLSALMLMTESALWPLICLMASIVFSTRAEIEAISNRATNLLLAAMAFVCLGYWATAALQAALRFLVRHAYRLATRHQD